MNRSERLVGLLAARRPEPAMTVVRSVAAVLTDHTVFEVESIDRMYLNVWQPRLAYGGGVQGFLRRPSRLPLRIHGVDGSDDQALRDRHPRIRSRARPGADQLRERASVRTTWPQKFLARFTEREGVLFVGRAQ